MESLTKLRPDRDLQCYFERPSAIAAFSEASGTGIVVSGTWRQQFDWAVMEWNRDNVFEHPYLRNLPDGDLSGITLTYDETRTNCQAMDSTVYPVVEWPYLRIWSSSAGSEQLYYVRLKDYATAISGSYACASVELTLQGTVTAGDYIGVAWQDEQYNHLMTGSDTLDTAVASIAASINSLSPTADATATGATLRVIHVGAGQTQANSTVGANGNRLGAYGFVSGARTESWSPASEYFSGGASPTTWRIQLPFANLLDINGNAVPTAAVRKMRWTYAAAFQRGEFGRSEFEVRISNWQVTGSNLGYQVASPKSVRVEDDASGAEYSGSWQKSAGNFSGGTIHHTTEPGASLTVTYASSAAHELFAGTRRTFNSGAIQASVNGGTPVTISLYVAGEDVLARVKLASLPAGTHSVTLTHSGSAGSYFYFDFLEAAIPATLLPEIAIDAQLNTATDWDTDHSISLAPERTAWNMYKLGFGGLVNHYVGALWFYELVRTGHQYASGTITFSGTPVFSETTQIILNRVGQPSTSQTVLNHLNLIGETAPDVAKAFALVINSGYTGVRAESTGNVLTIYSRSMGADGNNITISCSPTSGPFTATASGGTLTGGADGDWRTDLTASPRVNRACRDWSRSFYIALKNSGLDVVAAFSMELQHGDPSPGVGIAQRYPSGNPVLLNTPALQTNFSPISQTFWKDVYRDMATVMDEAECVPYLQFGEVQWWYFPYDGSGLPFHDDYSRTAFHAVHGFYPRAVPHDNIDPALYPEEASFMPGLIGAFTMTVINHVKTAFPNCRFEVLYPPDVNEGVFNRQINYPSEWNPTNLTSLKTESFTYTYSRDLNKSLESMRFSETKGFARAARSHLIGISDPISPWLGESRLAKAEALKSIVLFALDQFCLIGYPAPMPMSARRSTRMG